MAFIYQGTCLKCGRAFAGEPGIFYCEECYPPKGITISESIVKMSREEQLSGAMILKSGPQIVWEETQHE